MGKAKEVRRLITTDELEEAVGPSGIQALISYARAVSNKKRSESTIREMRSDVEAWLHNLAHNKSAIIELPLGYMAKVTWIERTKTVVTDHDKEREIVINGQTINASYDQMKDAMEALEASVKHEVYDRIITPRVTIEANTGESGDPEGSYTTGSAGTLMFADEDAVDVP